MNFKTVFHKLLTIATGLVTPVVVFSTPTEDGLYAVFTTNLGNFTTELFYEEAPISCANLVGLAEGTLPHYLGDENTPVYTKFYDGLTFHRAVEGFIIQGGDPLGDGTGGPGYEWPDEVRPTLKHDSEGILSMANGGPNTNGSQFFVTLSATPGLDGLHNVFGKVVEGMETVRTIGARPNSGQPYNNLIDPVVLNSVRIIRIGEAANAFDPTFYAARFDPTMPNSGRQIASEIRVSPGATAVSVSAELEPLTEYRLFVSEDLEEWTEAERIFPNLDPQADSTEYLLKPNTPNSAQFVRISGEQGALTDVAERYSTIVIESTSNGQETNERASFAEGLVGTYQFNSNAELPVEYDWIELGPDRAQLLIRFSNDAELQFHLHFLSETSGSVYIRDNNFVGEGTFTLIPSS